MSKKEININNYNDDAIQVLEGLDGSVNVQGCISVRPTVPVSITLVWEIVDNAVDMRPCLASGIDHIECDYQ